jgi:hypothetical protein
MHDRSVEGSDTHNLVGRRAQYDVHRITTRLLGNANCAIDEELPIECDQCFRST